MQEQTVIGALLEPLHCRDRDCVVGHIGQMSFLVDCLGHVEWVGQQIWSAMNRLREVEEHTKVQLTIPQAIPPMVIARLLLGVPRPELSFCFTVSYVVK